MEYVHPTPIYTAIWVSYACTYWCTYTYAIWTLSTNLGVNISILHGCYIGVYMGWVFYMGVNVVILYGYVTFFEPQNVAGCTHSYIISNTNVI